MEPSLAGGIPQFGTELVTASDDSIVFPGASAGASTAVWIMLGVIERCFRDKLTSTGWADRSKEMIPSCGSSLIDNPDLCPGVRAETAVLNINDITIKETENDLRLSVLHRA